MDLCLKGANLAPDSLGIISLFEYFLLAMVGVGLDIGNGKNIPLKKLV